MKIVRFFALIILVLSGGLAQQTSQPERTKTGDFIVELRKDLMTDDDRSSIFTPNLLSDGKGALVFRCRQNRFEVVVSADEFLERDVRNVVHVRVDGKGSPVFYDGPRSTNGRAIFLSEVDHARFIQQLSQGVRAVVRLGQIEIETYTYLFGLSKLPEALKLLPCYKG
jgi:hypothetical protein